MHAMVSSRPIADMGDFLVGWPLHLGERPFAEVVENSRSTQCGWEQVHRIG